LQERFARRHRRRRVFASILLVALSTALWTPVLLHWLDNRKLPVCRPKIFFFVFFAIFCNFRGIKNKLKGWITVPVLLQVLIIAVPLLSCLGGLL
jgi:putative effector of murein hydrolase